MNEMSLLNTRPLARRSPLAISVILHAVLLSLLTLIHSDQPLRPPIHETLKRSVIVLNFRDLPSRRRKSSGSPEQIQLASSRAPSSGSRIAPQIKLRRNSATELVADAGAANKQPPRPFELPSNVRVQAIKQTLVQFDVPPDVLLKQEVPLPNVVFWTEKPAPFRKRFVAPPVKVLPQRLAQNISPIPDLPNREPAISDLKLSAQLVSKSPLLVRPLATTSPVRMPGPESLNQIPQIVLPESNPDKATALIALADSPTRPNGMVIVPPANQISNLGASGSGRDTVREGSGAKEDGQGNQGISVGNKAGGEAATSTGVGVGPGDSNGSSPGLGNSRGGTGYGSGTEANGQLAGLSNDLGGSGARSGSGVGSEAGDSGSGSNGLNGVPANVTRITLPKDGKFGVVVTGSSQATPYPETIGALSGKMVYTVYLSVGLHKKWILQYCLTKEAARLVPRGSGTPLEAPWPFLVFRPDHLEQPGDYVVVHGMINTDGRFDQLAMVFPDQFQQQDLLISSLKLWSFRPASRDRQPTEIEILLIIPAES